MGIFDELFDMLEELGTVMYFVPPPDRQHLVGCTCTWPKGYPGCSRLDPRCKAHAWVRPAQAAKKAALTLPIERWEDDGGKPAMESP